MGSESKTEQRADEDFISIHAHSSASGRDAETPWPERCRLESQVEWP